MPVTNVRKGKKEHTSTRFIRCLLALKYHVANLNGLKLQCKNQKLPFSHCKLFEFVIQQDYYYNIVDSRHY